MNTTHPTKPTVGDFVEFHNGISGMVCDIWYSGLQGCMVGWIQVDPESDALTAVMFKEVRYSIC